MSKNKKIRWGIIGCGDVTERKSGPAYRQTDGFELVAVMRRDLAKAQDYADRHGVPMATDRAEDLLADTEIDAIYIATPPDSHMAYALQVAEAGKICCIEKPLTPTLAEGEKIIEAFADKDLPLFVAYYRRYLPRFLKVKTFLDEGRIGTVRHLQWTYCCPDKTGAAYDWRYDKKIAPGGLFDDLASHGLDLFGFLLGEFTEVKGIGFNQQAAYTAMDAVTACWTHSGGVTGMGTWNFGSALYSDKVEVHGDKGCMTFSVFAHRPVCLRTPEREEVYHIPHPDPVQKYHVQAMSDQLFRGVPHASTGQTALHTAWVMDRILFGDSNCRPRSPDVATS
ncbi:Gfo/Idh/MocA family oxidoreductase [Kiritimatiellaeota bacterium B1221]|nr:Gfo/Idh/MocA family oxidoreductase [Kiritimatiellaeota bacterium B1221]